jgi:hypothetical protein
VRRIKTDAERIFGEINWYARRQGDILRISACSTIIGESLCRIGGTVGDKSIVNPPIPWIVKENLPEITQSYFSQVFSDEGWSRIHGNSVMIEYGRGRKLELSVEETFLLKNVVEPHMMERKLPTKYHAKFISIRKAVKLLEKVQTPLADCLANKLTHSQPRLLLDEARLLREKYGLSPRVEPRHLNKFKAGYSTSFTLVLNRRADVLKFYREIGFACRRKQTLLEKQLRKIGWLNEKNRNS